MAVNRDKPGRWKADVAASVDMYNDWFMRFAPKAFRETRVQTTKDVESTLRSTGNLANIQPAIMRQHPEILPTLLLPGCRLEASSYFFATNKVAGTGHNTDTCSLSDLLCYPMPVFIPETKITWILGIPRYKRKGAIKKNLPLEK